MVSTEGLACSKMMKSGAVTIFYQGRSFQSSEQAYLVAQKVTDVPYFKTLTNEL